MIDSVAESKDPTRSEATKNGPITYLEDSPLLVTENNIVLLPDGMHVGLTNVLSSVIASAKAGQVKENRRLYIYFLQFAASHGESPLDFLEYDEVKGVNLVKEACEKLGLIVKKQENLSNNYFVTLESGFPNYLGRLTRRIRVIYNSLKEAGLVRVLQNPAEIPGWHELLPIERTKYARATVKNDYGMQFAGARFVVRGRKKSLGRPQDPRGIANQMSAAVAVSDAPEVVKMLCQEFDCEAPRVRELLLANSWGWSMSDFGHTIYIADKWKDDPYCKPAALLSPVHAWLIRNFEGRPHPTNPDLTMMDWMRQLKQQGRKDVLETIFLFEKEGGGAYSYSGLRYWFLDAMLVSGIEVDGWTPSLHFFRNCRMDEKVREIFRTIRPGNERDQKLKEAGEEFGHQSSAWKNYTCVAIDEESRAIRREKAERRNAEAAARRAGVPLPPKNPRLQNQAAAQAHSETKRRGLK